MHPGQALDSRDFPHEPSLHQDIDPKSAIEVMVVKCQGHSDLPLNQPSGPIEPSCQNCFVNGLEQAWAQITMAPNRCFDDSRRHRVD